MKVELEFIAAVNDAVNGVKKIENSLSDLGDEAKDTSAQMTKAAAATDLMADSSKGAAVGIEGVGAAINTAMGVAGLALVVITGLVKAFDAAEKSATAYGNVKVSDQFDKLHNSVDNALGLMLELPIAGKNVLEWFGDMAEEASNVITVFSLYAIGMQQLTGEITAQEAAVLKLKLANDEFAKSNDDLIPTIDAAKKALQAARQANFEATGYYGNFRIGGSQGNYQITGPNGQPLPGRAAGGPVMAGSAYMVGERGPETFIPKTDGAIVPAGAGGSLTVVIQAGAFLGDRADALRVANQLAPEIQKALQRTAAGGYRA